MVIVMFLRALFAFLVLPGVFGISIPMLWAWQTYGLRTAEPFGLALLFIGLGTLLWCVRDFYVFGKGTLAPWSPPRHLVTGSLYAYSRNPMYISVITMLLGWATTFASPHMFVYALVVAFMFHVRVVFGEEPWLLRTHGQDWLNYERQVPRWL